MSEGARLVAPLDCRPEKYEDLGLKMDKTAAKQHCSVRAQQDPNAGLF